MRNLKVPYIDEKLIEYLSRVFPDRLPQTTNTDNYSIRDIDVAVGQQSVIRHLKSLHESQIERSLQGNNNKICAFPLLNPPR